eukprot:m.9628 g.9628  ORF g.9628 m.9628 type:complete len:114 (-) comp7231_c0_seq1:83-424(-)
MNGFYITLPLFFPPSLLSIPLPSYSPPFSLSLPLFPSLSLSLLPLFPPQIEPQTTTMTWVSTLYNTVLQRNSRMLIAVIGGAFVFERVFDPASDAFFKSMNRGKSFEDLKLDS